MKKISKYIIPIILGISFLLVLLFSIYLFSLNMLPTKYLVIYLVLVILIYALNVFLTFKTKKKIFKAIVIIISLLLSIGVCVVYPYINKADNFLNKLQAPEKETINYDLIVLKDMYTSSKELEGKKLGYVNDDYADKLKSKILFKYEELVKDFYNELPDMLINQELDAIILEDALYNLICESDEDFENKTTVLEVYKIEYENKYDADKLDITKPFIFYISGIDQYGNVKSVRGRSDVNQLVIVNPKTAKILLVNTPRDYYVQLAGTTGVKDKLTHAGVYGINKSINTLENLYGIEIDHYLRINFDTLIKVVDVIGGIDVYSSQAFNSSKIKGWHVPKGMVHMNGKQALAFSRERYAFLSGDRKRGENQQAVISALIKKMTSSKTLISKYEDILKSLEGTFQTDMSKDSIKSIIRYQLDKMPSWDIESISVTGYDSHNYTYSMGMHRKLYVMEPNQQSMNNAKNKINETLKG